VQTEHVMDIQENKMLLEILSADNNVFMLNVPKKLKKHIGMFDVCNLTMWDDEQIKIHYNGTLNTNVMNFITDFISLMTISDCELKNEDVEILKNIYFGDSKINQALQASSDKFIKELQTMNDLIILQRFVDFIDCSIIRVLICNSIARLN
jgi:hypothetical protein